MFREGADVTIVATGTMTAQAMLAADLLAKDDIWAEVVHVPTIKPLDTETILESVRKTRAVISIEEAQINGGLGGAVAELLAENLPTPMKRMGMPDHFGESGKPEELFKKFGMTPNDIRLQAHAIIDKKGA